MENANNPRKNYAGRGDKYDKTNDAFVSQKPTADATLDANFRWKVPVKASTFVNSTSTP